AKRPRLAPNFNSLAASARLSPDDSRIAVGVGNNVEIWTTADLMDDNFQRTAEVLTRYGSITGTPDGYRVTLNVQGRDSTLALAELATFGRPFELSLASSRNLTDAALAPVTAAASIRSLSLEACTSLTAAGMRQLAALKGLEALDLSHVPITDAVLADLKGLDKLARLNLTGVRVTGKGLATLTEFKGLRSLTLTDLDVEDEKDLAALGRLTELTELTLGDLGVGNALARLKS